MTNQGNCTYFVTNCDTGDIIGKYPESRFGVEAERFAVDLAERCSTGNSGKEALVEVVDNVDDSTVSAAYWTNGTYLAKHDDGADFVPFWVEDIFCPSWLAADITDEEAENGQFGINDAHPYSDDGCRVCGAMWTYSAEFRAPMVQHTGACAYARSMAAEYGDGTD